MIFWIAFTLLNSQNVWLPEYQFVFFYLTVRFLWIILHDYAFFTKLYIRFFTKHFLTSETLHLTIFPIETTSAIWKWPWDTHKHFLSCSEKKDFFCVKIICVKNYLQCSWHSSIFVTSSLALCWPRKRNTGLIFSHWLFKACPCYFDPVIKIQCYLFNAAIAMWLCSTYSITSLEQEKLNFCQFRNELSCRNTLLSCRFLQNCENQECTLKLTLVLLVFEMFIFCNTYVFID